MEEDLEFDYHNENMTFQDYLDEFYANFNTSSHHTPSLNELLPVTFVYGLAFVLGLTGNLLVIVAVVRCRRLQTVTNMFLISLASADLLLVILCVPAKLVKWFTFTWTLGAPLCKLVHYMQNVSVICSILTLTAISLERYNAIVHPMRVKYVCTMQRTRRLICGLWLVSLVLAVPTLFTMDLEEVGTHVKGFWCSKRWVYRWQGPFYELAMLFVLFVIPLCLMTYAYVSICHELAQITKRRRRLQANSLDQEDAINLNSLNHANTGLSNHRNNYGRAPTSHHSTQPRDDSKTRKQVIKMLLVIILLFVVCWGPLLVDNVLTAFHVVSDVPYGFLKPMRQAFSIMAYMNSCTNPIVYAFMSRNFRASFKSTLRAMICCVHKRRSSYKTWARSSVGTRGSHRRHFRYGTGQLPTNLSCSSHKSSFYSESPIADRHICDAMNGNNGIFSRLSS